jgi:dienelactone hydrolase
LPAPTGPHQVGRVDVHLVDPSRRDPFNSAAPARELMASIWYPAAHATHFPVAPQQLPGAAQAFGELAGKMNYGVPTGTVDWAATMSHAHWQAPVERGRWPVVLYSPGLGDPRDWNTSLVEDLASRGYVVVTIDHTYESSGVEFPGGRVVRSVVFDAEWNEQLLHTILDTRVADTRFVLDQLGGLSFVDPNRIAMVGQSGGGFTALQAMHDDRRIKAAVNMDGQLAISLGDNGTGLSTVATDGVDRPFLLFGTEAGGHEKRPSWASLWQHSTGWHRDLLLTGTTEGAFTDSAPLLHQGPADATAAKRAYVASFLDRFLRGHDDHLLDAPSAEYPHVQFLG